MDVFIEQLTPYILERLANSYQTNEEYQECLKQEDEIYEKLSEQLPDEQADQLEQYFTAASATTTVREKIAYIQGAKDFLTFFKFLSK